MIDHDKVHYHEEYEKFAQMMDISACGSVEQMSDPKTWEPFIEYITKVPLDDTIPKEEDLDIRVGTYTGYLGKEKPYCVMRPKEATGKKMPCVIGIHGGNWMSGYGVDYDSFMKSVARELNCCAVAVEYTGREEAAFPAATEDCYLCVEHIWENADEYGIDKENIILSGESAGGNLAVGCLIMLRDRKSPVKLKGQCIVAPALSQDYNAWSHRLWGENPPAAITSMVEGGFAGYGRDGIPEGMEQYFHPLKAESFVGLPPAYVEAGDNDTLASDTILYATELALAEIPTIFVYTKDTIHGSVSSVRGEYSDKLMRQRLHGIRRLLEQNY